VEANQQQPRMNEIESIPPARILFRDGKPVNEVITERSRLIEPFVKFTPVPREVSTYLPRVRGRVRMAKAPAVRKPRAMGRGQGWHRNDGVTVERIAEMQASGMFAREIAAELGCSMELVFKRAREARRADPEQDKLGRVCACGKPKWPSRDSCSTCRYRKKRAEIRKVDKSYDR